MTVRLVHQRTGALLAVFHTYEEAAEYRAELRKTLPPDQPCPYAIRTSTNGKWEDL